MNVLKPHLRTALQTLLDNGATQREIERFTGVDRKTIRRYQRLSNSSGVATGSQALPEQIPPPRPPAAEGAVGLAAAAVSPAVLTPSACEPYRAWIEVQVGLGRNAVSIYQDLVEAHGFGHAYNSVKRFVARLKARAPERFDVLEFLPGEEAQVDYGQGALTLYRPGKYRRPYLFVMTGILYALALSGAEGALQAAIEARVQDGLDIPAPSRAKRGERMVSTPVTTALKAAVYLAMREDGVSKSELARLMQVNEKEARRMLDPHHPTRVPTLERALAVLGRRAAIAVS